MIKDRYIEVSLTDTTTTGLIRPGGTVNIAPAVTNNGDIVCFAFIKVAIPLVGNEPAYSFSVDGSWIQIESNDAAGHRILVYAYGMEETLTPISVGGSTDPLRESRFTMKNEITGVEFGAMDDIDIGVDEYLVDAEITGSAVDIWNELGQ